MKREKQNITGFVKLETLEDRRLMSSVQLVDGMLILQGKHHGHNRLSVTPDDNGTTVFARANGAKGHYLLSDIKTIRIVGGEKSDTVDIAAAINKPSYIRVGAGHDTVRGGSGSDTVFGGAGADSLSGGAGDDLLYGQSGPDKIAAGHGDDAEKISPRKNKANKTQVRKFLLIDANTNKTIGTLVNGATLNLARLPRRMNVAVSLNGKTGSVRLFYDGQEIRTENLAPYALAADDAGNFNGWTPKIGPHTLSATPYAGRNATGAAGSDLTITFTVINDDDAPGVTGAGATPSEIKEQDNPNSVDNTKAPSAVIDLLDTTVPAGNAMHFNALKTALNEGDALKAKYEWNFGDAGSKYNTLSGFNVAHAYTKAGTYTVTLTVTNSAGKTNSVTRNVTVTAANRRFLYVSPTGNDANNGSTAKLAVKTFARAAALVGDDTEVLFQRGATYNVKSSMRLDHYNVAVGSYGQGAKPVLKYTSGNDYGAIFVVVDGRNIVIRDLAIDSSNTGTNDMGYNDGIRVGGQNITVRDCTFVNAGYAINTNGFPDGVLVQDNIAPNKGSLRTYFAWVQGADHVYLGNTAKDSIHAHNLRIGGADRVNIQYNNFTNDDATAGMRGTLTIHKGSYVYVANNSLYGGSLGVGPLNQQSGLRDKDARMKWVVLENNVITSRVQLGHGTDHVAMRNNLIKRDDDIAIDMPGWSEEYGRGISDVYIENNTVINNGTTGKFLKVGSAVAGVTITNNLYVAPNLTTGLHYAAPIQINNKDLAGFRLIANNVWPEPTILDSRHGGINYVGDDNDSSGYKTPAQWEAYNVVQHDQYKDVTLGSTYRITLGGITAGANLKKAA